MTRLLVTGGRSYDDVDQLYQVLDDLHVVRSFTCVIQGGARGADALAARWAALRHVPVEQYEADWSKHGRAAGPIHNRRMLTEGRPDLVVAFPGGRGTQNMIRQAQAAGVDVVRVL